jgi:hypothetical protein
MPVRSSTHDLTDSCTAMYLCVPPYTVACTAASESHSLRLHRLASTETPPMPAPRRDSRITLRVALTPRPAGPPGHRRHAESPSFSSAGNRLPLPLSRPGCRCPSRACSSSAPVLQCPLLGPPSGPQPPPPGRPAACPAAHHRASSLSLISAPTRPGRLGPAGVTVLLRPWVPLRVACRPGRRTGPGLPHWHHLESCHHDISQSRYTPASGVAGRSANDDPRSRIPNRPDVPGPRPAGTAAPARVRPGHRLAGAAAGHWSQRVPGSESGLGMVQARLEL